MCNINISNIFVDDRRWYYFNITFKDDLDREDQRKNCHPIMLHVCQKVDQMCLSNTSPCG